MNEGMPDLGDLKRDNIVRHRLIEIVGHFELGEGACDFAHTFYRLDSGAAFTLPGPWADTIGATEPPPEAKPIQHSLMEQLLGQEIVEVYRAAPDSDLSDDSPYVLLRNGYIFTDIMGSPKGISDEGLWVFRPGEIKMSDLLPFWAPQD